MKSTGGGKHGPPKHFHKQPRTPDPRVRIPVQDDATEAAKLHQKACKFWKFGKCNWGWGCRFLHGSTHAEDPRRPEYRGPAIDFTQFPRPIVSSPHFNMSSPLHADDQSRVKALRNPVVDVVLSGPAVIPAATQLRDTLLRNNCDVINLPEQAKYLTAADIQARYMQNLSDYIVFIDLSGITVYPGSEMVSPANAADYIHDNWDIQNNNLNLEQLELLTTSELEGIITKLTTLDNIETSVASLQNDTADAISSISTASCKYKRPELIELRMRLYAFFARLNLANSIISDMPIYASQSGQGGMVVSFMPQPPTGLSAATQKVLIYMIGRWLSQIHMCIAHVNRMLGELQPGTSCFAVPGPTSPGMHPTPLCAPVCAAICGEERAPRIEFGRRLEPEVAVEMPTQYSISFRDSFDTGFSPFAPPRR